MMKNVKLVVNDRQLSVLDFIISCRHLALFNLNMEGFVSVGKRLKISSDFRRIVIASLI